MIVFIYTQFYETHNIYTKGCSKIYRIGAVKNDKIIDFYSSNLPNDMINFIKLGDEGLKQASQIINLSNAFIHLMK